MRSFLIFGFLSTAVLAAPAQLGYGYGPGVSYDGSGLIGGGGNIGFGGIGGIGGGIGIGGGSHYYRQQNLAPIISKNFYVHSAPEETEQEIHQDLLTSGQPRKHYNVVFIKAPKHSLRSSAISYAQQLNEQRTAIYVLSKKPDVHEIQSALQDVPHQTHKPEVFFIKYQTPEEAQHAQHQIQTQYDQLGGSSHISDEGFAPVTSVIGSLGGGHIGGGHVGGGHVGGGGIGGVGIGGGGIISSGGSGGFISSGSGNFVSTIGGVTGGNYLPPQ